MSDCDELNDNEEFFDELIQAIQREESTPILGPGLLEAAIGVPFGSIVQDWRNKHHYPLPTYEPVYHGGLPRLAQHRATTKSETRAIRDLCNILDPPLATIATPPEPYTLLASLGCSYYVTTNIDTLLEDALKQQGKSLSIAHHPWNGTSITVEQQSGARDGTWSYYENGIEALKTYISEDYEGDDKSNLLVEINTLKFGLDEIFRDQRMHGTSENAEARKRHDLSTLSKIAQEVGKDFDKLCEMPRTGTLEPDRDKPFVYKMFGSIGQSETLALLENHYFTYLMTLEMKGKINERVKERLHNSSLLFLGFRLEDWTFRVIFQSLMKGHPKDNLYPNFVVHPCPDEAEFGQEQGRGRLREYREYLEEYVLVAVGKRPLIYWGDLAAFFADLKTRLPEAR